jgi:sugar/nucleoside kinase (ribokinase family)
VDDSGQPAVARLDVLGLGAVAIDDLLYVASYPPVDAKARVLGRERRCGGLAGTALVAAARLGARCAYAGVLGTDRASGWVLAHLAREGVDVAPTRRRPGVGPIRSTIIIGREDATRTVFSHRGGFIGPDPDWPPEAVLRAARVVLVDHIGVAGMARAARFVRGAGIPVVADFERDPGPGFPELLALADHLVVGRDFAARLTGEADPAAAARALWRVDRAAVVVTCGAAGCWAVEGPDPDPPRHCPAFAIAAVDTTGCGDVFHGAYAAALARGEGLDGRLRLASAAAALKASRPGGRGGIPTRTEVLALLDGREEAT